MSGAAVRRSVDHRGPRQSCPIEVCSQRNHKNRLQNADQGIALPHHDATAPGLLARTASAEIGPPNFSAFHRRSSRSRVAAQSPRPSSASLLSSAVAVADNRSRSNGWDLGAAPPQYQRVHPVRSGSRRIGRSTPFSNSASMISMHGMDSTGRTSHSRRRQGRPRLSGTTFALSFTRFRRTADG